MFDEDNRAEPPIPRLVLWRCRRCRELEAVPALNPLVTVREAVESGHVLRLHACADAAQGVADLVGTGPGHRMTGAERSER